MIVIRGGAGRHYSLMSMTELYNLPIQNICAEDCILFMWVTYPFLQEGLDLIKAWGFTYKTIGFQWVKLSKNGKMFWGCGNWTRANSELCLIATKGKIKRISRKVHQIIDTPIEEHSKKPAIVRDKIIELVGDLPKIELFAREKVPGWDAWGDEIISDINIEDYKNGGV